MPAGGMAIATVDLEDNIQQFSPLPVAITIWSEQGSVIVRDSLSNRALRVIYEDLEEALGEWGTVLPHLDRRAAVTLRFPGWPNHSLEEALATGADYVVVVTGSLRAKKLTFRVKGARGSRLVPVVVMRITVYDRQGKRIRQIQGRLKGDPMIGGVIQSGDWQIGQSSVVMEKEVIDLCRQLGRQLVQRVTKDATAAS
jgi:hypothetical protein